MTEPICPQCQRPLDPKAESRTFGALGGHTAARNHAPATRSARAKHAAQARWKGHVKAKDRKNVGAIPPRNDDTR